MELSHTQEEHHTMAEQSIKLPGYYIITMAGPYRDPPLQTNPDEEIKYWGGHKWLRGAPR